MDEETFLAEQPAESVLESTLADYARDVEFLGVEHRATDALRRLMTAGMQATPVVRQGLQHPNPAVRVGCCKVLDHFLAGGV